MKRLRLALALLVVAAAGACDGDPTGPAPSPPQRFATVAAGFQHTCATTTAGRTYCWGNPHQSRLGNPEATAECAGDRCPEPIPVRTDLSFASLAAGEAHTCGLADGRAYCWGFNRYGQLGDDDEVVTNCADDLPFICAADPHPVAIGTELALVTAARRHACALAVDGRAICWGSNIAGQLGRGDKDLDPHARPWVVNANLHFSDLSTGFGHTCGVTQDGDAYCWGSNEFGLLGVGDAEPRLSPARVIGGRKFERIAAGGHFTCAIETQGDVYCWGWGYEGRLGAGNMDTRYEPGLALVPEPAVDISAGQHHTCVIGESGTVYCWGANHLGPVGVPGTTHTTPQAVPLPEPAVELATGFAHACAITSSQSLYCWGDNGSGQLGIGSNDAFRSAPALVNP